MSRLRFGILDKVRPESSTNEVCLLETCPGQGIWQVSPQAVSDRTNSAALRRLKEKWFINPSAPVSSLASPVRHEDSVLGVSTDGNLVTPLIDGESYMRQWADSLAAM